MFRSKKRCEKPKGQSQVAVINFAAIFALACATVFATTHPASDQLAILDYGILAALALWLIGQVLRAVIAFRQPE